MVLCDCVVGVGACCRLTGIVLFKLFGSATDGIRVHQGQMEMVERAAKV